MGALIIRIGFRGLLIIIIVEPTPKPCSNYFTEVTPYLKSIIFKRTLNCFHNCSQLRGKGQQKEDDEWAPRLAK